MKKMSIISILDLKIIILLYQWTLKSLYYYNNWFFFVFTKYKFQIDFIWVTIIESFIFNEHTSI